MGSHISEEAAFFFIHLASLVADPDICHRGSLKEMEKDATPTFQHEAKQTATFQNTL